MDLKLPETIASKRDVLVISREIEHLLDGRLQNAIINRAADDKAAAHSGEQKSATLTDLLALNKIEDTDDTLKTVKSTLNEIRLHSPLVRVVFANEPNHKALQKIVRWFRAEISPTILLQVGIQPSIAGGCIIQTSSRRYDFSLRTKLLGSYEAFTKALHKYE